MRLHLGCGKRFLPGWVHVDIDDHRHVDHRRDIRDLSIFTDASADEIYFSHGIIYFDRVEIQAVLAEWRRVLIPGGVLRLSVPDFEALVEVYRETGELDRLLGPLYGRIEIRAPEGPRILHHRTVYDFAALKRVLEAAGFVDVRRFDWRKVFPPAFDDFTQAHVPHMAKESGRLISLNVEARKP